MYFLICFLFIQLLSYLVLFGLAYSLICRFIVLFHSHLILIYLYFLILIHIFSLPCLINKSNILYF